PAAARRYRQLPPRRAGRGRGPLPRAPGRIAALADALAGGRRPGPLSRCTRRLITFRARCGEVCRRPGRPYCLLGTRTRVRRKGRRAVPPPCRTHPMPKVLVAPMTLAHLEGRHLRVLRDAGFEIVWPPRPLQLVEDELDEVLGDVP